MRNLSSAFRHEMYYNSHTYDHQVIITLSDRTVLTLTNTTLWTGGFSTDDAVSDDNSFTALGSTIIGAAKVIINNIDEAYSQYDFTNAKLELSLSKTYMLDGVITVESIRIGRYTVDECVYNGGTITLSVLDNMEQFDRPYSLSDLVYPAELTEIVQDACLCCGVDLNTYTFPHSSYTISTRPDDAAITFRDIIGWVATIAGCFARCNSNGELELKWFDTSLLASLNEGLDGGIFDSATPYETGDDADGGSFNPWNTGDEYDGGEFNTRDRIHYLNRLYSQTIGVDDIVITGIQIINEETDENNNRIDKEYSFGEDGYIIKIEKNKLINKDNVSVIGTWLANAIVGMRFRNVNITHIDDPSIEAGDIALVIDRKQNEYPILVTRTSYSAGGSQTTVCGAESPSRNSATRFSQITQAYVDARNLLNQERTRREAAIAQLTSALNAKSGLYTTEETAPGGGTIFYLHDKPLLEDSAVVWKMTAEAWGVTTDYQGDETVWNGGMTVNGDVIARILTATGVNADWINVGAFTIDAVYTDEELESHTYTLFKADATNKTLIIDARKTDGTQAFYVNSATGRVVINANSFSLSGTPISSVIDNKISDEMTQANLFNILFTDNNQGVVLVNGKLYINWEYAKGGALTLGDTNNTKGYLEVIGGYIIAGINNDRYSKYQQIDVNGFKSGMLNDTDVTDDRYINIDGPNIYYYNGNTLVSLINFDLFTWLGKQILGGIHLFSVDGVELEGPEIAFTIRTNTSQTGSEAAIFKSSGCYFKKEVALQSIITSSAGSVVRIQSGGTLVADTSSSKRYKNLVGEMSLEYAKNILKITPLIFRFKDGYLADGDECEGKEIPGFFAEDVEEHYPMGVYHLEDGKVENWRPDRIIPAMLKVIQDQQKRIEDLETRLAKLEALLN